MHHLLLTVTYEKQFFDGKGFQKQILRVPAVLFDLHGVHIGKAEVSCATSSLSKGSSLRLIVGQNGSVGCFGQNLSVHNQLNV